MPRRPAVRPSPQWRFPVPVSHRLDNGLVVDRFDLPGQRVVTMTLILDAPLSAEPRQYEGVAALAMRALDEGTLTHPGSALTDALEGCGAETADAGSSLDGATITIDAPATRLHEAMPLLTEMITEPAFAPADIARLVQDRLLSIATGEVSPAVCATKALHALVGSQPGDSPSGHRLSRPSGGDATTVAALTPDAVRAWFVRAARPDRARLVVAGDLPASVDDVIDAAFGAWLSATGSDPLPAAIPPPLPAQRRVALVDRPSAAQVSVRIGTLAPTRSSADWPALQVANAAVGAMFGSRLNRLLREERGLTYGAGSGLRATRDVAFFSTHAECAPMSAAEATRLALDCLNLDGEPVTTDEVRDAIAYITGATPLNLATSGAIANQAVNFALGGVAPNWFDDHMEAVRRVTPEQATQAFMRHLGPHNLVVTLCGPAESLLPALAAQGLDAELVDTAGRPATGHASQMSPA